MLITAPVSPEQLLVVANSYHQPEARDPGSGEGTEWLPAHDHLETPEATVEYLRRKGIRLAGRPNGRQLAVLRAIREAALVLATERRGYERRTAGLLRGKHFRLRADANLLPVRDGWDGFIDGLLIALVGLREQADRLKLCENEQCRWLFIDQSKNRSRQWCESASCGNRQRVRRFRRRLEVAS